MAFMIKVENHGHKYIRIAGADDVGSFIRPGDASQLLFENDDALAITQCDEPTLEVVQAEAVKAEKVKADKAAKAEKDAADAAKAEAKSQAKAETLSLKKSTAKAPAPAPVTEDVKDGS